MSSGYFPLDKKYDDAGKELVLIAEKLEKIRATYLENACTDLTPEDACSDGGYLEYLSLAKEFIERCIK